MHGHEDASPYVLVRLHRELRTQVHIGPVCVVLPGIDQGYIERTETCADARQVVVITGVTGVPRTMSFTNQRIVCPKRLVRLSRCAAGLMPRRRRDDLDGTCLCRLPPVELAYAALFDAPPRDYTERHDEHSGLRPERDDGVAVEMIVVIVRDEHCIERRQIAQVDRGR